MRSGKVNSIRAALRAILSCAGGSARHKSTGPKPAPYPACCALSFLSFRIAIAAARAPAPGLGAFHDFFNRHADRSRLLRPPLAQGWPARLPHFGNAMLRPRAQFFQLVKVQAVISMLSVLTCSMTLLSSSDIAFQTCSTALASPGGSARTILPSSGRASRRIE